MNIDQDQRQKIFLCPFLADPSLLGSDQLLEFPFSQGQRRAVAEFQDWVQLKNPLSAQKSPPDSSPASPDLISAIVIFSWGGFIIASNLGDSGIEAVYHLGRQHGTENNFSFNISRLKQPVFPQFYESLRGLYNGALAVQSDQDLFQRLGGEEEIERACQRFKLDWEYQTKVIWSVTQASVHLEWQFNNFQEVVQLMLKVVEIVGEDLSLFSERPNSSFVDISPVEAHWLVAINSSPPEAEMAYHQISQRWKTYLAGRMRKLNLNLSAELNLDLSPADAGSHWQSVINEVLAKNNDYLRQESLPKLLNYLSSKYCWADLKQKFDRALRYETAEPRGKWHTEAGEMQYLDWDDDEQVPAEPKRRSLTGEEILVAIERDRSRFEEILDPIGLEVLKSLSYHEGEVFTQQIAQEIGTSPRTVERRRREIRKQQRLILSAING